MAKRGAPKGNQNGRKENREWANAIRRAVKQRKRLGPLAEALLNKAESGDVPALKEFGDRYDGKVAQPIEGPGENGEFTFISKIEEVIVDPKNANH